MYCLLPIEISYIALSTTITSPLYAIEIDSDNQVTVKNRKLPLIIVPPTPIHLIIESPKEYNINNEIYFMLRIFSLINNRLTQSHHLN